MGHQSVDKSVFVGVQVGDGSLNAVQDQGEDVEKDGFEPRQLVHQLWSWLQPQK